MSGQRSSEVGSVCEGKEESLICWSQIYCHVQGKHLYAIGGERVTAAPASSVDEDEDLECLSDVCQFDEEAKLWMQLPISGDCSVRMPFTQFKILDRIRPAGACLACPLIQ